MAQAVVEHVLEEIKTLLREELREVKLAARGLQNPADKQAERESVLRVLYESGLVKQIKRPPIDADRERALVAIQGKPLSETIIEERR